MALLHLFFISRTVLNQESYNHWNQSIQKTLCVKSSLISFKSIINLIFQSILRGFTLHSTKPSPSTAQPSLSSTVSIEQIIWNRMETCTNERTKTEVVTNNIIVQCDWILEHNKNHASKNLSIYTHTGSGWCTHCILVPVWVKFVVYCFNYTPPMKNTEKCMSF